MHRAARGERVVAVVDVRVEELADVGLAVCQLAGELCKGRCIIISITTIIPMITILIIIIRLW